MKLIKYIIICLVAVIYTVTGQVTTPCVADTLQIIYPGVKGPDYTLPELDSPRISTQAAPEDYRMLYWVHGLNGDGSSWDQAAAACEDKIVDDFPPREVIGYAPSYYESQPSIFTASWKFRQDLPISNELPLGYDPTKSFVIAHSQGGIVSRYTDYYYTQPGNGFQRKFGGIVTFGTPNQGAQIVNNQVMVSDFLYRLGDAMSAGPVSDIRYSENVALRIVAKSVDVDSIRSKLLNFLSVDVAKYLISVSLPGITDQYKVGAPMLTDTLDVYESPSDLVAFYGVRDTLTYAYDVEYEDDGQTKVIPVLPVPISWATINYFLKSVNEEDPFTAQHQEHVWTVYAAQTRATYQANADRNERERKRYIRHANLFCFMPLNPACWAAIAQQKRAGKRREAWLDGVRYIDKFDREYRTFTGALVSEDIYEPTQRECVCTVGNGRFDYYTIRYFPKSGEPCRLNYVPEMQDPDLIVEVKCEEKYNMVKTGTRWRHKESDGVVLVESAMNIPQHTFPPQPMEGTTHMRMRNDDGTESALTKIFEGDVGNFFRTKKKGE